MEIDALQAFLAVADSGSFTRGAQQVFLTQPAISKRIAALEEELGTRLFDREGRRVRLTAAGQALMDQARTILNEVAEAKRRIAHLSDSVTGPLKLGTSYHVGLHRLRPALHRFSETHPAVHLDLRFMDSEAACLAVADGQLELAVVTLPKKSHPRLRFETVWLDPLDIVVAPNHPLATMARVTRAHLTQYPAILPVAGTYTREQILAALGPARDKIQTGMETNYLDVIKMLVAVGLGWSALPRTLIDAELKVVHIEEIRIERKLGIVTHRGRTLSNAARVMIDTIKHNA